MTMLKTTTTMMIGTMHGIFDDDDDDDDMDKIGIVSSVCLHS